MSDSLSLAYSHGVLPRRSQAKQTGGDPFAAIETILPWEVFSESVTEAEKLAQPEDFDYLPLVGDGFNQLRRYTPALLEALTMKAAPCPAAISCLPSLELPTHSHSGPTVSRLACLILPTICFRIRQSGL